MYERYTINKEIKYKQIIPAVTMFMELANKDLNKLSMESLSFIKSVLEKNIEVKLKERQKFIEKM